MFAQKLQAVPLLRLLGARYRRRAQAFTVTNICFQKEFVRFRGNHAVRSRVRHPQPCSIVRTHPINQAVSLNT
jgi:hypothetical protein